MKKETKDQENIGALIKMLRIQRGMTQAEFAKRLKTSQSAVARMESGKQNFTSKELEKISRVLHRKIVSVDNSTDFKISGGRKLKGTIQTNTSKNGALHLMTAALINDGKTTLRDVPKIEEVFRVIEIYESLGIKTRWVNDRDLEIQPPKKYDFKNLDREAAAKVRSSLMIIGALIHKSDNFSIPHSGGCKMGDRTIAAHRYGLEEFGVKIQTKKDSYEISHKGLKPADIVMYEAGDTAATNLITAAARIPGITTIRFAPSNYMVQDVCFFMEKLGVKIEGIGTSTLKIHGVEEIDMEVDTYVGEDPIESMMFIAAAIVTDSELKITRCPIDFLDLELQKLKKMGLKFKKTEEYFAKNGGMRLVDLHILPSNLKAPTDKLHPLPYPGINVDNLPFFVPICTQAKGQSLIHDWMWESRAIYFTELNRLGADVQLADPHRVFINGPTALKATQVVCPPALRPAMIILIAMLGAPGESVLRNVYSINRGYEEVAERLNKVGADIEVIYN